MKRLMILVAAVALSQFAQAQAQVDLTIARLISEAKAGKASATADSIRVVGKIDADAVEKFNTRAESHDFAHITAYAGGVAVVKILTQDIERLRNTPGVTCLEFPFPIKRQMDKGRAFCGVDLAQCGEGLPGGIGFDGKGVTVIVADGGLDYNHPAFRDKDGNTRLKLLALRDKEGNFHEVSDPQEIAKLTTDGDDSTHATHVMSIAAGTDTGNGYGGVAPGADLVFVQYCYTDCPADAEGLLYSVNTDVAWTLEAVQKACEIAKRLGGPTVTNLSLGNDIGARDGSDLASQFVNALSQEAILCFSAGNSGRNKDHVHHTFTRDGETARVSLADYPYNGVQFFADNDRPFTLSYRLDSDEKDPVTLVSIREEGTLVIDAQNTEDPLVQKLLPYMQTPDFRIEMRTGIYHNGKRFAEIFTYNCSVPGDYRCFQLELAADAGTHIDGHVYMWKGGFTRYPRPGELRADDNGSINVFATGTNVISVGAMAARATVTMPDGTEKDMYGEGTQATDIGSFSGWTVYPDGTSLPHIIAPGYNVVAAGNLYSNETAETIVRTDEAFGRKAPYVALTGTSMAAPYATGVVALWLQANPDLTPADLRAIMKKTAKTTPYMETCPEPGRWGWGVIDAYAGVKEALAMPSTINDATSESPQLVLIDGNTLEITTRTTRTALLYNVAGTMVASTTDGRIDISTLPHGIYFVKVPNNKAVKVKL